MTPIKTEKQKLSLKRNLNLPGLIFYGTGIILGAGIYSLIGKAAALVGTSLWISFILAAFSAGLTALSYCELSALKPESGAEYTFLKSGYPDYPWLATAIGLIMSFAGIATASAVALAFGGYLSSFFSVTPILSAFMLLTILTAVNIVGVQESSRFNIVLTTVEVSGLLIFIYLGFSPSKIPEIMSQSISPHIMSGAALIIFAYFGFEDIVNLAEETKNPEATIPKAILWSLGISTIIYILVGFAALSIAPIEKLISSDAPLMDAATAVSPKMAALLGICALFSTANTVLIAMLAASRTFFGMAKGKSFPSVFAKILPKKQTPWLASLLVLALSIVLLPLSGGIEIIASVSSLATLVGFFTVNIVLIKLRYSKPMQPRPFTVPFKIGNFPILPAIGALTTVALLLQFERIVYIIGFLGMGLALAAQFVFQRFKIDQARK